MTESVHTAHPACSPAVPCDVLVVGAGAAGLAAAITLAGAGLDVHLADQGARPGGAFFRQSAVAGSRPQMPRLARLHWLRLLNGFRAAPGIRHHPRSIYLGVDEAGIAMLDNRIAGSLDLLRPRAVILATGAVERIRPRPGWQLPGVMTAGGLQVLMKETGRLPKGRIMLAGNGPLLIALAAQLVAAGRKPVAVLDQARPLADLASLARLVRHPRLVWEGAGHLFRLAIAGVRWETGCDVTAIERGETGLRARVVRNRKTGMTKAGVLEADVIVLHDGIRPNDFGLASPVSIPIVRAGDCREALGWVAAEADGYRAARAVIELLDKPQPESEAAERIVTREREGQALLARIFARSGTDWADMTDSTVLCRCEGKTLGDIRALLRADPNLSAREIKLIGRFSMGACQGRFCADSVVEILRSHRANLAPDGITAPVADDLTGRHWPARPVTIASLIAGASDPNPD